MNRFALTLLLFLLVFPLGSQGETKHYLLSDTIHHNRLQPFITHHGSGRFSNYLSMNINYAPMKMLLAQLTKQRPKPLKTRNEAHITVITPVEFHNTLGKKLSIEQIDNIALEHRIQTSEFEVVCLGRGQATVKGKNEETFFVVVSSPSLLNIRRKVHALYVKLGGAKDDFRPEHYFPHITLGFSGRDLHESDGVIKNQSSCVAPLNTNKK